MSIIRVGKIFLFFESLELRIEFLELSMILQRDRQKATFDYEETKSMGLDHMLCI